MRAFGRVAGTGGETAGTAITPTIFGVIRAKTRFVLAALLGFAILLLAVIVYLVDCLRHSIARLRRRAGKVVARATSIGRRKVATLQAKLTVLYAALFGIALIVLTVVVYVAISQNAEDAVRDELIATGTVFDHVWELKSKQLQESAELTADIAAFARAVAARNHRLILSALANLRQRFDFDVALTVTADGKIISSDMKLGGTDAATLRDALKQNDHISGVFTIDDRMYHIISAPVLTQKTIGWIVLGVELDRDEMRSLEGLAAIPLTASVLHRMGDGTWHSNAEGLSAHDARSLDRFLEHAVSARKTDFGELTLSSGTDAVLVKPLASIDGDASVLLLKYPVALAFAPYRALLLIIAATGLIGLVSVITGSWALARHLTGPISALVTAAHGLQRGDNARVNIKTKDELGWLGRSFNTMAEEIQAREEKITNLALHDAETGLPNRRALEEQLEERLTDKRGRLLAVSAIGVDRFAFVRGAIGYDLATELIREIGERLKHVVDQSYVARLSTDILGFMFEAESLEDAESIIAHVLDPLEHPARVIGNTVDVSLTIGTTVQGIHGEDAEILLERATIALDQARAAKQKQAFFDPITYGDPASNLSLISDMLRSLENGEMAVYYQPKLDIRSGHVTGAEALVRWHHPTRGLIQPDLFIGMAEETGQIRALTDWVLARVIADQAVMRENGDNLLMSVNISGRLLSDLEFAQVLCHSVRETGAQICAEITETAVIENPEMALEIVAAFKSVGVTVSIDDYGSGLSSLSYLKQINANELKIDKSLILPVADGKKDALLVKSTIDLAHSIGMKVTAEGVETDEVLALLAGMGCDIVQGYLIAKPLPFPDFVQFVQQSSGRPVKRKRPSRSRPKAKTRRLSVSNRA